MSGEFKSVNEEVAKAWKTGMFPSLLNEYHPKDVSGDQKRSCSFCAINIWIQIMYNPLEMALIHQCTSKEQAMLNQLIAGKREVWFGNVVKIDKKYYYAQHLERIQQVNALPRNGVENLCQVLRYLKVHPMKDGRPSLITNLRPPLKRIQAEHARSL
jgi:hypothetical protein